MKGDTMQTHRSRILFTGIALQQTVYMLRVALNLFTVCTWVCTRVCLLHCDLFSLLKWIRWVQHPSTAAPLPEAWSQENST